ncbi:ankyrin repeat domain-containing protein, partial [Silvimonas sp.]|uniref:ankyrin repeat domain-containing protein n=1 Tax=Silvimonas sp. TaxID=2650811 RepID=UPI0028495890
SDCLRFFVAKGADVNAKQKDGMTALMWASLYGDVDCVKDLISNGADVNAKDNLGETALTDASNSSYKNGLAPVFDGPSDMVTMSERYWNACRFATKEGKSACVKLLAEHGADLTARNDYPQWAFKEALGMHAKTEMQHMADKHWFLYFTWFRKGGDIKFQDYILSDNGAIDMRRNMWNLGVQWNSASITNNAAFRVLQLLPPLPTGLSEPTNVSPSRLLIVSHLENKMWITKYYDLYELPVAIKSMITAASKGNHPMPPLPVFR